MLEFLSKDGKTYPETVAAARERAQQLKLELEKRILGKELPAWSCGCGGIHSGTAKAVSVRPAGMEARYQNQIACSGLWGVHMEAVDGIGHGYSTGLSDFLSKEVISNLFAEYFADIDIHYLEREDIGMDLRPKGTKIEINAENAIYLKEGKSILDFHRSHNASFEMVQKLIDLSSTNEDYLRVVGALHLAKGGDTISIPSNELLAFAVEYKKFARIGSYILLKCGDTISLDGVLFKMLERKQRKL